MQDLKIFFHFPPHSSIGLNNNRGGLLCSTLPPKINHDHHKPQQSVASPHSGSLPCRLLCNRLEVLIHFTLVRVMWGVGARWREKEPTDFSGLAAQLVERSLSHCYCARQVTQTKSQLV